VSVDSFAEAGCSTHLLRKHIHAGQRVVAQEPKLVAAMLAKLAGGGTRFGSTRNLDIVVSVERTIEVAMRLRTVVPHPEIAPFVHHFWVFESPTGLPAGDARVVVPNGRPKLIVPWKNALTARRAAAPETSGRRDDVPVFIGQWEEPTIIASTPEPTVTIGVEFLPHGLTRVVPLPAEEITGRIQHADDVLGALGRELSERVGEARATGQAVEVVHRFLVERVRASAPHPLALTASLEMLMRGPIAINELERRMGYSRRYLHALYVRHVGLPPKQLARVLAFEKLYRQFAQDRSAARLRTDALEVFYDQPHFIRTFRRFAGHAPGRFAELDNEFGRLFYVQGPERSRWA
jgi:AraC-like DNA-binding protein